MKVFNILLNLAVIFLITSCNHQNIKLEIIETYTNESESYSSDTIENRQYIFYNGNYKAFSEKSDIYNETHIFGELLDSIYGHYFIINLKDNKLDRYSFDVNSENCTYCISKNKEGFFVEEGTPLVDLMKDISYLSPDSVRYEILFTVFPRKKISASYHLSQGENIELDLHKSKLMPLLYYGIVTIPKTEKNAQFKIIADSVLYKLKGLDNSKTFETNVSFIK